MLTILINALFLAAFVACFYTSGIVFLIALTIVIVYLMKTMHDFMMNYIENGVA